MYGLKPVPFKNQPRFSSAIGPLPFETIGLLGHSVMTHLQVVPQRLKPRSFRQAYVRAEARTLQEPTALFIGHWALTFRNHWIAGAPGYDSLAGGPSAAEAAIIPAGLCTG